MFSSIKNNKKQYLFLILHLLESSSKKSTTCNHTLLVLVLDHGEAKFGYHFDQYGGHKMCMSCICYRIP